MSKGIRILLLLGVVVGGLGYAAIAGWWGPVLDTARGIVDPPAAEDFSLTIEVDRTTFALGETPKLLARIQNNATSTATLVPALDGSLYGMRYPKITVEVVPPDGVEFEERPSRCGNTNNIHPGSFFAVPAGERFELLRMPGELSARYFPKEGTYTLRLTYDTTGERQRWYGFMGPLERKSEIDALLARVPAMRLVSNEISIEVVNSDTMRANEARNSAFNPVRTFMRIY